MASERKMYLLTPNCYVPPNTSVRLGDIILHPTNAQYPVLSRESAEFPHFEESHGDGLNPDLPTVSKEITTPWTGYVEGHSSRSGHVGHQVYTKTAPKKYMCDELETQVLNDAENYIKKRAAAASVRKEMKPCGGLLRKSVYMITGIMIARGFEIEQSEPDSNEHKRGVNVKLSLRPVLPISLTAGFNNTSRSSTMVNSYKYKGPFVFAFKVHRLTLEYFHKDISIDLYTEGAKFDGPGESSNQSNAMTKRQIGVTEEDIQDIQVVEVTEENMQDIEKIEEKTENLEHVDATPLSMEDLRDIPK